jgi:hypothetical protein
MTLTFIECGDQHLGAVREFFSRVYRSDYVLATDETLLRWQFGGMHAPRGPYHIKLAVVDDRIAACLGYIPADVDVYGRSVRGAWTANWIVDPASRQMALGPRLMNDLVRQHEVTLVAGASSHALAILPRLGFTNFGELLRYICVIDPDGVAALTGTAPSAWRRYTRSKTKCQESDPIVRVDLFDEPVERVWDSVWAGRGAGTRRSAAFLNWRYTTHPRFNYRLFVAGPSDRPTGFAVYRVEAVAGTTLRMGRVLEFVGEPGADDALLGALILDAESERVVALDYFCSSARPAIALARRGWLPESALPGPVPVLLQPVAPGRRAIPFLGHVRKAHAAADIQGWYVTKGDGDQDRPN